ncbi:MAG: hypothetical protein H6732_19410 [Alphaproteobacteria bacterium]|nr:hypothetical protein [Alphaproteobacteria bacterium]
MPLAHPFALAWLDLQAIRWTRHDDADITAFVNGPFAKAVTPVDKALRAFDSAVMGRDRKKAEKAYLAFLKGKLAFTKKLKAEAKKHPKGSDLKDDLKAMFSFLEEFEGIGEMEMPAPDVGDCTVVKDWKFAKKKFEAATGKKKPAASMLKVFKSSSGIGKALEAFEKGLAKGDGVAIAKARNKFGGAMSDYLTLLDKEISKAGSTEDYKVEVGDLRLRLQVIEGDVVNLSAPYR